MAQFLRPDSNITQTNFTGGFAEIDESTASDADFAYGDNNTDAVLEVGTSNPAATPDSTGTCTVRYRIAKTNNGTVSGTGNTVTVTTEVYEGSTLIQSDSAQTTSGTWTQYTFTFAANLITDWTDVRIRFTTSRSGGSPANRRGGAVSWAEIEAPNAAPVVLNLDVTVGTFSLVGVDTLLQVNRQLVNSTGTFSLVGNDADFSKSVSLDVDPGTFTLAGTTTGLLFQRNLIQQTGPFTLAGINAILARTVALDVSNGPFTVAGQSADFNPQKIIISNTGTFSFVGNNSLLQRAVRIDATTRTYTVAGVNAILLQNRQLVSQTGTFSIAGVDVILQYNTSGIAFTLDTVVGAYSLAGTTLALNKQVSLINQTGTFTVVGNQLGFIRALALHSVPGTFSVAGKDSIFSLTKSFNLTTGTYNVGYVDSNISRLYQINGQVGTYQLNTSDLDYFSTRRLEALSTNLIADFRAVGNFFWYQTTQTIQPVKYKITKRNEWILGRATHMGRRGL